MSLASKWAKVTKSRVLTFNGYCFNDRFAIGNISRPLAEYASESHGVDGADGERFGSLNLGTRRFSFDIMVGDMTPAQVQEAARELAAALLVREPGKFTFSDERADNRQLFRYAVPDGPVDVDEFMHAGKWTLDFVQHDPFLYKAGEPSEVHLRAGEKTKVVFGGTAPCFPMVEATCRNSTYYKVTAHDRDGDEVGHVTYKADFATFDPADGPVITLEGESPKHTLYLDFDRQSARMVPPQHGARGLQPGSEFFACHGKLFVTSSHNAVMRWRERYA